MGCHSDNSKLALVAGDIEVREEEQKGAWKIARKYRVRGRVTKRQSLDTAGR